MPREEEVEVLGVKLSSDIKGYHGLYHRLEKGRRPILLTFSFIAPDPSHSRRHFAGTPLVCSLWCTADV
eukprot:2962372-Pyramimonas_sp.AAC.1